MIVKYQNLIWHSIYHKINIVYTPYSDFIVSDNDNPPKYNKHNIAGVRQSCRSTSTAWHQASLKVVVTSNLKIRKAYINYDLIFNLSLLSFDFSSKLYLHCYCSSMIKKASKSDCSNNILFSIIR